MSEYEYWIWFASVDILPIKKIRLLEKFKEVNKIYNAFEIEILQTEGLNLFDYAEIEKSKKINLIMKYKEYINNNQINVININDKLYPENLKRIYDAPVVLFTKGNLDLLKQNSISIVGSRDANEYGLRNSYKLDMN